MSFFKLTCKTILHVSKFIRLNCFKQNQDNITVHLGMFFHPRNLNKLACDVSLKTMHKMILRPSLFA